jgi:OOP family OmpA-OmpF porin
LFDCGKFSFKKQTYPVLQSITLILKEYPYSRFLIKGHTDGDGSYEMNQALSQNRAHAVKSFLSENAVTADRLEYDGYSETKLIDTNKIALRKVHNRRVEIALIKE